MLLSRVVLSPASGRGVAPRGSYHLIRRVESIWLGPGITLTVTDARSDPGQVDSASASGQPVGRRAHTLADDLRRVRYKDDAPAPPRPPGRYNSREAGVSPG